MDDESDGRCVRFSDAFVIASVIEMGSTKGTKEEEEEEEEEEMRGECSGVDGSGVCVNNP